MIRLSSIPIVLAILVALAPAASAQPREREPQSLDALRIGKQVAGERLTRDDLEGRVVLVYHWCVS